MVNCLCKEGSESVTSINNVRQALEKLTSLSLSNLATIWSSCGEAKQRLALDFFKHCFATIRFQEEVTEADAPSIARLFLLYITCPQVEDIPQLREDCQQVWELTVQLQGADSPIKKQLLHDLGMNDWPQAYQQCFVNTFFPYLIGLDFEELQQLRERRGAKNQQLAES